MNKWFDWILGHVRFFLMELGVFYLLQELWNWFDGDSLLRYVIPITVMLMLFDLYKLLIKKIFPQKKNQQEENVR